MGRTIATRVHRSVFAASPRQTYCPAAPPLTACLCLAPGPTALRTRWCLLTRKGVKNENRGKKNIQRRGERETTASHSPLLLETPSSLPSHLPVPAHQPRAGRNRKRIRMFDVDRVTERNQREGGGREGGEGGPGPTGGPQEVGIDGCAMWRQGRVRRGGQRARERGECAFKEACAAPRRGSSSTRRRPPQIQPVRAGVGTA